MISVNVLYTNVTLQDLSNSNPIDILDNEPEENVLFANSTSYPTCTTAKNVEGETHLLNTNSVFTLNHSNEIIQTQNQDYLLLAFPNLYGGPKEPRKVAVSFEWSRVKMEFVLIISATFLISLGPPRP